MRNNLQNKLYKEYSFLKEVDSCALRNSLFNLENAYKRFYNGSGHPKFKAKNIHNSYKTNHIIRVATIQYWSMEQS